MNVCAYVYICYFMFISECLHMCITMYVLYTYANISFSDTVLQWFSSYLTDRTQYVSLFNHCSAFAPVHSGVPQGSVLSLMLFTMYSLESIHYG